ncbi:hypothetical protein ACET3Z_015558 [Daucus carota]
MALSYRGRPSTGLDYLNSDTTLTKLFVGGLAWETQSPTLHSYFRQFGEILEAVVITDKNTGRSKGYGFVTFRDPESAKRACADPSPIIDGRRANCNLAALGRPPPALPIGHNRLPSPYYGGMPSRGAYIGNFGYQQPYSYGLQQGLIYPQHGFGTYGSENVYPQGAYNPYAGQQYLPIYGVPGTVNTAMYPYNVGQNVPSGQGYTTLQGYALPGHQIMQFGVPTVNSITTPALQTLQSPYPAGVVSPMPARPQLIIPVHSPQIIQSGSSDQNTG